MLYLCDGRACGDGCPNGDCHHTKDYAHALHKDADLNGFERRPLGDGVMVLVEPLEG